MAQNFSAIAIQHVDQRPDPPRAGAAAPWGACIHTSGGGIVDRAKKEKITPIEAAVAYYDDAEYSTHYAIGYEGAGDIHQITADDRRVQHIGSPPASLRRRYLNGTWVTDFPIGVVKLWRDRWPGVKSPQHLFPSEHANSDFVGIEMIPLAGDQLERALRPGLRFTAAQHTAAAALLADLGRRHGWPLLPTPWWRTSRLVGHEDVGLHNRTDVGGGWDPGAMRLRPRWCWPTVLELLDTHARS